MAGNGEALHSPLGLLAELTHRCPLGCPYCSNPLALDPREGELDTAAWARVFGEAAGLGVLQVHLSGGEPGARRDLVAIAQAAHDAGLYTNLITSAVGITAATLRKLADAGLDHVQISIQDSEAPSADRIAGYDGAFARKRALAAEVVGLKIPLTVNAVMHRANIDRLDDMVALALELGASRVEIAHAQYYGWALKNRAAPTSPRSPPCRRTSPTLTGGCDRRGAYFLRTFFFGTFLPLRRASERPMVVACLRLFTFLPLRPLLSAPRLRLCIAFFTSVDARREYLRAMFNLQIHDASTVAGEDAKLPAA